MSIVNRTSLKNYFKSGNTPNEKYFEDLIDSTINIAEDGINRSAEMGLSLQPTGSKNSLLSFFKDINQKLPNFSLKLTGIENKKLSIVNAENIAILSVYENGKIVLGNEDSKNVITMQASVGMSARFGTTKGEAFADGKWHPVLTNLNGLNAIEIVAICNGKKGSGKHAISCGTAVSAFGGNLSNSRIKLSSSSYGNPFRKIKFRWSGSIFNYSLEAKTTQHFGLDESTGNPFLIKYNLCSLLENGFNTHGSEQT